MENSSTQTLNGEKEDKISRLIAELALMSEQTRAEKSEKESTQHLLTKALAEIEAEKKALSAV